MKHSIETASERLAGKILDRRGISGVGVGVHKGRPCLKVFVSEHESAGDIPSRFEGHPVRVVGAGVFRAQGASDGDVRATETADQ